MRIGLQDEFKKERPTIDLRKTYGIATFKASEKAKVELSSSMETEINAYTPLLVMVCLNT